jgi:antitoxin VapB
MLERGSEAARARGTGAPRLASPDFLAYAPPSAWQFGAMPDAARTPGPPVTQRRKSILRIPRDMELDAEEATIRRVGDRLIVEPVKRRPDLAALIAGWEPLDAAFPDVDQGLLPLDDIRL